MLEDNVLIAQSQQGDMMAFEQLIQKYERKIYTIAYKYMGNHEDANDLAQEAFIKAYQAIGTFRADAAFSTWLGRITANKCLDELRRRKRQKIVSLDEMVEGEENAFPKELKDPKPTPAEETERQETAAHLQMLINRLQPDYQEVIILREIEGYSYEEIAERQQCSLGTVKSRISRARKLLKEWITAEKEVKG